jgi:hypothetical protein
MPLFVVDGKWTLGICIAHPDASRKKREPIEGGGMDLENLDNAS